MLSDVVSNISGVGPKITKTLYDANIRTKNDLILFMPIRYINYEIEDISKIDCDSTLTIRGTICSSLASIKLKSSTGLLFYIISNNIKIKILAFGMEYLRYKLKKNEEYVFFGAYKYQSKELYIKSYFTSDFKNYIEPVYNIKIPNSYIMKFISEIYKERPYFKETLPDDLLKKHNLLDINSWIYKSHFPNDIEDTKEAIRRNKYENYLKYNIRLNALRYYYDTSKKKSKMIDYNKINEFINELPYELSSGQKNAISDILKDLNSNFLMNRLLQGDVGSGKTIVALIALYANYLAGYKGALMVPSEVLSVQHYNQAIKFLEKYKIRIVLLNSGVKESQKKKIYSSLENGEIDIVIGTQSLINNDLILNNLGLVIIDEQHKFGVVERQKLISKGIKCDALFMTATPIPRTLGITKYADLSISTIDVMPSNRKKVLTRVCDINDTEFISKSIYKNVLKSHQVFVVVPVINESVIEGMVNIDEAYKRLSSVLPNVRFGLIHGGMKNNEKNEVMEKFKAHEFDCLISTTVIEVGIDISNATLIIIYNAERYGLATLHQLRGRVGRNDLLCGCILATSMGDSERLKIMEETNDCFELSEADFNLRGPGDILGSVQSGFLGANFLKDIEIFKDASADALEIYNRYISGEYIEIVDTIIKENDENNKLN